jgi:hypothetical protein
MIWGWANIVKNTHQWKWSSYAAMGGNGKKIDLTPLLHN